MFLARAVGLHLTPGTADPPELQLRLGEVQVVIKRGPEGREGPSCLAVARVPLKRRPKRTGNGYVVVPDLERKVARLHLEIASNLVSLGTGSRRALSSPNPYLAFEAQSDDERTWLAESAGLQGGLRGTVNQSMKQLLPLEHRTIQMLSDRQDGIAFALRSPFRPAIHRASHELHAFVRAGISPVRAAGTCRTAGGVSRYEIRLFSRGGSTLAQASRICSTRGSATRVRTRC
jgi:hypothetical protein